MMQDHVKDMPSEPSCYQTGVTEYKWNMPLQLYSVRPYKVMYLNIFRIFSIIVIMKMRACNDYG